MNNSSSQPASVSARACDVLILGGGVIGLSVALFCLRAGRAVTILEQKTPGSAASHGNCGTITPSHLPLHAPGTLAKALKWMLKADAPLRIKPSLDPALLGWLLRFAKLCNERDFLATAQTKAILLKASRLRLEQLIADEGLACEFERSGTLYVYREIAGYEHAAPDAALLRSLGIPCVALDGPALRAREPALNDSVAGGYFHPDDARLRPNTYIAELVRAVRAAGGVIEQGVQITGFETANGRIDSVQTSGGRYRGRDVVLALGAWSPQFGQALGLKIPIQPGKGYSITYSRPGIAPVIPMVLKERSVCVTAWDSGYRLGSTMEFAGYDSSLNRLRLDALSRGAAEYLQEPVGPTVEEEWYGWRPMTPDDLPIIGRAPHLANLTLATGHGMLGVSLSAITGQLVAELLSDRPPSLDLAPYAPTRF
ncbi:NAD(P)/FAD-dependent oxidoreductase [Nevskia ramosa]|uniref:NAD(P)/FAD-dependent oxidoreductase n=1 Tax=Nevskia ramosa TaxID=64002 RepID=UPI0003B4865B|nr:FAD-dependent oxidoreductase [Nevskia ramosa]